MTREPENQSGPYRTPAEMRKRAVSFGVALFIIVFLVFLIATTSRLMGW